MNKFKVGDRVYYIDFEGHKVFGTVIRYEGTDVYCDQWSEEENPKIEGFMREKDLELDEKYAQQQEAKKLLGLK